MKIESTFLRSKLGRRILQLFFLAALLPVGLLAGISLWRVGQQLREQDQQDLRQASHDEGMAICERLKFIEAEMRLIAAGNPDKTDIASSKAESSMNLARQLRALEFVDGRGASKVLFGNQPWPFPTSEEELSHLRTGKPLLATRSCGDSSPCIFMATAVDANHPENGLLISNILPAYLLDRDNLPENKEVCVLGAESELLICSGKTPTELPASASRAVSGQLRWSREGKTYNSNYWRVFLKPTFFTEHWTVVTSEAEADGLLPLAEFKRIFVLVVSLALLAVLLLSVTQIRREMVPLGQLQEGTHRIADGGFDTRVHIKSGDEFEELAHSFNSMAERIEKQFHTLQTNNRIDRAILSSLEIEEIVSTLTAELRSVLPYEAACVSFFEAEDSNRAKNYMSWDGGRKTETSSTTLDEQEIRELSSDSKISIIAAGRANPGFLAPLTVRGMNFFLVAPVMVRNRMAAIIALGHGSHAIWGKEEREEAQQIADRVAVALANARLVDDLKRTHTGMLTALARAIDAKSHWTAGHSERVTNMALRIAMDMGLPAPDLDILWRGGLLHDIGKIGIDSDVLDKPGKLTPEEMAHVREHVEIGRRILEPIPGFRDCLPVVMHHHEKFDGTGYPYGLAGENISLHGRIFAVADCYDAVVSDRPYRPSLGTERAVEIIRQSSGTHFDPRIVEVFLRIMSKNEKHEGPKDTAEALAPSVSAV